MIEIEKQPREECGVFGLYVSSSMAGKGIVHNALEGCLQNQHRGEESVGISISDGHSVWPPIKSMGRVSDLYNKYLDEYTSIGGLYGHIANVHNRYSTTGFSNIENASPFRFQTELGAFAISHNGNITNAAELKSEILARGVKFSSTTDSEVIGALIAISPGSSWQEKISWALEKLEGAFCLVISTQSELIAARDKFGIHPLFLGESSHSDRKCYAFSSETPALDVLRSVFLIPEEYEVTSNIRSVEPGELVIIDEKGVTSTTFAEKNEHQCGLETAYLMRPDSYYEGVQLYTLRRNHGKLLAQLHPVPKTTEVITYVPESAKAAAEGFAQAMTQLYNQWYLSVNALLKVRYGSLNGAFRGFINPDFFERVNVAENCYYPLDIVKDREIALIEDSIIAGVTLKKVVTILKESVGMYKDSGASKIHVRIIFPQVISSCPFGVDIDKSRFLVAKELAQDVEEIRKYIGVDSLAYLSVSEYRSVVDKTVGRPVGMCLGCTTGEYPQEISGEKINKLIFESEIK